MTRILVLAPRFPSINQPWIDTYLEQLLIHNLDPMIYSTLQEQEVGAYSGKVDQLGLRQRVLALGNTRVQQLQSLLSQWARLPELWRAWTVAAHCAPGVRGRLSAWLSAVHFGKALAKPGHPVLIHSHSEQVGYGFLPVTRLLDIPLVLTFHGLPPTGVGQLSHTKRKLLYQHAEKVIVNTEFAKRQVMALGCPPEKVTILPQGLPLEGFPFLPPAPPTEGEPVRLLTVGRYHRDKGQGYALVALRRLLDRGISAQWTFVGVGQGKLRLQQLAARLQLQEHVQFLENIPSKELPTLYQQHHCFVLPSITSTSGHVETQGVVLQEAQASGCIPIASRVGGIPECLNHERDALLVPQKSSRVLADAVQFLLGRPEQWATWQRAGRSNVEHNYSADVIGAEMAVLLARVQADWKGYS